MTAMGRKVTYRLYALSVAFLGIRPLERPTATDRDRPGPVSWIRAHHPQDGNARRSRRAYPSQLNSPTRRRAVPYRRT